MPRILIAIVLFACFGLPSYAQKLEEPDSKELEAIFGCLADGLPQGWKKTWVVVTETGVERGARSFEAQFFYAIRDNDASGVPLKPCNSQQVAEAVYALNKYLTNFEQRQWRQVKLVFTEAGGYNLTYEYGR